jgi:hypothetical protein
MQKILSVELVSVIVAIVTKKPILNFVIDPDLLLRVDAYQHKHHIPSRAAAIKHLLAWALKSKAPGPHADDEKGKS